MKLLLTSGGVTNSSIAAALVELLGKPIAESHALVVPTAQWGHPMCGPTSVRGLVAAESSWGHLTGLGWASIGVLELTALPSIGAARWEPWGARRTCCWWTAVRRYTWLTGCGESGPGRAPADADRRGVGRGERREYGDDAAHGRGVRRVPTVGPG